MSMKNEKKKKNFGDLKKYMCEAKNLSSRNNGTGGTAGVRDVYCTVALDQEEICRTPTIERTLSPFFGEEYQFKIPRTFRYLSVYVWDRDRHIKQDKPVGKIAIRREELENYNDKDHWFSLRPVDADSEVQGMAHIQISFEEIISNSISNVGSSTISYLKRKSDFESNNVENLERLSNSNNSSNFINDDDNLSSKMNEYCLSNPSPSSPNRSLLNKTKTADVFWNLPSKKLGLNTNNLDVPNVFRHGDNKSRVGIHVTECIGLTKKNGTCDPFLTFTAMYSNKRKITKRTKVRKKTVNPQFDEIHYFDLTIDPSSITSLDTKPDSSSVSSNNTYTIHPLGGVDLCEICISAWHDTSSMAEKIFLGEIKIPIRGNQQQSSLQTSAWYYFQPRTSQSRPSRSCATPPGTRLSCDNSLGSLRLKIVYSADHVFPLATYDSLLNLLLQSVEQQPITTSAVYILGEIVSSKTDVAQPLVRLFTHTQQIAPIIKALADHEISNLTDPTTIFRGNTLVSKMMDEAMRLSGLHYLHNTLRPVLDQILHEKKPCEIDPARVKDKSVVVSNLSNLQEYVEKVFDAITKSAIKCPTVLCQIFHDLRECAAKHFPLNKEVRYSVVSGFIFLRFFAPAILGPKLFDLTNEPLDTQTNRTLTLISKTIQSLGNLVSSRSAQQPCKEEYTGQLYKKFCTEKHVEAVKHFLEVVSTVGASMNQNTILEPVLLKEGMMTKRAQGRKRFGRRNFKQRYFRLTTHSLSYSKSKGKRSICDIPLSDILGVERVQERSFKMQNIFQIIRKDRPLYVQTTNCVEEKEWVDLLTKICLSNSERLQSYHPCAYINGIWSCCSLSDENADGCTKVSNEQFQIELATALDPARDLQRIHTLIISHLAHLEAMLQSTTISSNSGGTSSTSSSGPSNTIDQQPTNYSTASKSPLLNVNNTRNSTKTILSNLNTFEETLSCQKTIHQLTDIALNLDQVHRTYKQILARDLRYGSRQAPIGDDNYLHMMRSGLAAVAAAQHQSMQNNQISQSHHQCFTNAGNKNFHLSPILPLQQSVNCYSQFVSSSNSC
ncbi:GTPase-activating protein isoform X2 [Condylostylus longicornis]|uniref:GTPase-activating protein isoform X2 n=1 Tax=Condylostylus longicornis TaxID=2530218 RepID=UPI00244E3952|nr:GTPase-activating protein isoform X2 [Condylostylus longicornis]